MNFKKSLSSIGVIAAIASPIAVVVSCGSSDEVSQTVTAKDANPSFLATGTKVTGGKTLSAIVSDPENPRWKKAQNFLQENGTAQGFATTTSIAKAAAEQNTWLGAHPSDALIIGATDDTVTGAFTSWQTAGAAKPIIAYDRLIKSAIRTSYNWYVAYDNSKVGFLQGASILGKIYNTDFTQMEQKAVVDYVTAHKLTENKTIAAMGGDPADNNAGLFYAGGMDLIKAVQAVDAHIIVPAAFNTFDKVANAKWDYAAGQTKLQTAISALTSAEKSSIAGILSPNDGMATAAIQALKANALDPKAIYITGQDSNDTAITSIFNESGQDMTISKPDTQATAVAVALAADLIANPTHNVQNSNTFDAAIIAYIKAQFSNVDFKIDHSSYWTSASKTADANTSINTILLVPKVITKSNLSTYFDVK